VIKIDFSLILYFAKVVENEYIDEQAKWISIIDNI